MYYKCISVISNAPIESVIQALATPETWSDHAFEDDSTYNRVIDYINNLPDDSSIEQSEDGQDFDPTTVPVSILNGKI